MRSFAAQHGSDRSVGDESSPMPAGRRTLTMGLPARQGSGATAPQVPQADRREEDSYLRTLTESAMRPDLHAAPVQRRATGTAPTADLHEAAQHGTSDQGGPLPFLDQIQRSFGKHDLRALRAHTGDRAAAASSAMGADAYAFGDHVAFAGAPTLHTAAHEAAHVIQQRAGVHLKGGVGEAGDAYERHADEVADLVVAGKSAEELLSRGLGGGAGGTGSAAPAVQHRLTKVGDLGHPANLSTVKSTTTYDLNQVAPRTMQGSTAEIAQTAGNTMQTNVTYSPTTAEGDGTEMIADPLGPDHKLGTEPETGGVWHARTAALDAIFDKDSHIAGHLLNHQLGGPGNDSRNLAPITSSANGVHKNQVESHIKRLVNVHHAWVYYRVKIHYTAHNHLREKGDGRKKKADTFVTVNHPSQIECWWHQYDAAQATIAGTEGHCKIAIEHNGPMAANVKAGKEQRYYASKAKATYPTIAGGTPNATLTSGDTVARDPNAAYTELEYDDLILDLERDVTSNVHALHILAAALNQTGIQPSFIGSPLEVAKDVAAVLNTAPSTEESDAMAAVQHEADAFHANDAYPLDMKVLQESFTKAKAERDKRIVVLKLKAKTLYENKYEDGKAALFAQEFGDGLDQQLTFLPTLEGFIKDLLSTVEKLRNENQELAEKHDKEKEKGVKRKAVIHHHDRLRKLRREGSPGRMSEVVRNAGKSDEGSFEQNFDFLEDRLEELRQKDDGGDEIDEVFEAIESNGSTGWGQSTVELIRKNQGKLLTIDATPYFDLHPPLAKAMDTFVKGAIDSSILETLVNSAYRENAQATHRFLMKLTLDLS
jgi:Domain of unknown function (DUF4157)/DNA/RNA non-specific endonuclease